MKALRPPLDTTRELVAAVGTAVRERRPFAAGKIGFSEQHWLYYPVLLGTTAERIKIRAYEAVLWRYFEREAGVYPCEPAFARGFVERHAAAVRELDYLGLFGTDSEPAIVRHHRLGCRFVHFSALEPDRSTPADDSLCYLPHFRGQRLLLVAPFAELLRQRAERDTFERVWARIGKRWFAPAAVAAVEFPYAFEAETQALFPTVLDLGAEICRRIDAVDFDVALIAAGALGIPLAAHVRRAGRIAISLGGHLQVLFGVLGERWRHREEWRRRYFNEAWIDMPERYKPQNWRELTDGGAYW